MVITNILLSLILFVLIFVIIHIRQSMKNIITFNSNVRSLISGVTESINTIKNKESEK